MEDMESKRPRVPTDLPAVWRERADWLRQFGDPNSARLWDTAARELDEALQAHGTYSLTEAAKLSGFTADHLSSLIKKGRIPNAGREGAPRIRRSDLPIKRAGGPGRPKAASPLDVGKEQARKIAESFLRKRR